MFGENDSIAYIPHMPPFTMSVVEAGEEGKADATAIHLLYR